MSQLLQVSMIPSMDWLTNDQAAELLGVRPRTVRKYRQAWRAAEAAYMGDEQLEPPQRGEPPPGGGVRPWLWHRPSLLAVRADESAWAALRGEPLEGTECSGCRELKLELLELRRRLEFLERYMDMIRDQARGGA